MLHWLGHRHQQPVVLRPPYVGRRLRSFVHTAQMQLLAHRRRPLQTLPSPRLALDHQSARARRQQRKKLVIEPSEKCNHASHDGHRPGFTCHRRSRRCAVSTVGIAVGDQPPVRSIQSCDRKRRRLRQPAQQRTRQIGHQHRFGMPPPLRLTHRTLTERPRVDPRLLAQRVHLTDQQAILILVEIEQRRHQQRQRQRVDQQHTTQQRRHPARTQRPPRARIVVKLPCSGSRSRRASRWS